MFRASCCCRSRHDEAATNSNNPILLPIFDGVVRAGGSRRTFAIHTFGRELRGRIIGKRGRVMAEGVEKVGCDSWVAVILCFC